MMLITSQIQAAQNQLFIDSNGALYLNNSITWTFRDFTNLGYEIEKDSNVYISEGELSKNSLDYDLVIMKKEKPVMFFEIREGSIYRGNLLSSEVPIRISKLGKTIYLGISIFDAIETLGDHENLGYGDSTGSYFSFKSINNSSFHTDCWPFHEVQGNSDKKLSKDTYYKQCKFETMLFHGNKKSVTYK